MGILDFWRFPRQQVTEIKAAPSLPAPTPATSTDAAWLSQLIGATLPDNGTLQVTVNEATAMNCTAVRCAVQSIAEAVGQLPLITYKRGKDGSKDRATEHPLFNVLRNRSSDVYSAQNFKEQLTRDALLYGNGFALINRSGDFVELWRIPPTAVTVELDEITYAPLYKVRHGDNREVIYQPHEIFHLMGPSLDGLIGASPIQQGKHAIELALILEEHGLALFRNRAAPSGVVTVDPGLKADQLKALKEAWKAAVGGRKNGDIAMVPGGSGFTPFNFTSTDAQYLELRRFAVTEIARLFRVPPHMLFDLERGTWANVGEMGAEFLTYSLRPWLARWENEVAMKLFREDERDTYFAEFLSDDLTRMDIAARADAYSKLISSRVLSPNEARAKENLPPYEGGDEFINPNTTSSTIPDQNNADKPA
ncbi:phage portal protein [Xanthobacter autotrophicus]|uniref:phage portal protein n=1 Tax=Xanthobacter TaxID=279 RepID=UPI0024AA8057|nr:phage portal protein [Xanthobacter autotrophicus]MDI4663690.1 phage portal protein [Xanthobacter autotrophicus]